jgi:hypothetical protein
MRKVKQARQKAGRKLLLGGSNLFSAVVLKKTAPRPPSNFPTYMLDPA